MTVLELDPPRIPHLRLVSSTTGPARDPRYRTCAKLSREARRLHRAVLADALADRLHIDPDAVRVVLAAKQHHQPGPISRFRADDVWGLMFVDVVQWCRARRLDTPAGASHAVAAILEYLHAVGGFHPDSDSFDDLWTAFQSCDGGWCDR